MVPGSQTRLRCGPFQFWFPRLLLWCTSPSCTKKRSLSISEDGNVSFMTRISLSGEGWEGTWGRFSSHSFCTGSV
jgi:hypothetical protein